MNKRSRSLFGHSALVVTTFALMLAGLVLVSRGEHGFANTASAEVGSHLQIAPASAPSAWSDSTGPAWGFAPGAPGTETSGYVWLRSADVTHASTTSMTMQTILDAGATPGFAAQIVVTSMELGSTDLLPLWSGCSSAAALTLADMASCNVLPGLPTPPDGAGATFAMVFEIDPVTGNAFQGATLGARFVFTLTDTTGATNPTPGPSTTPADVIIPLSPTAAGTASASATPSSTATATGTPATNAPTSTATSTPTPGGDIQTGGTPEPTPQASNTAGTTPHASVTPVAPYTGSGSSNESGLGAGLLTAGAILLGAWLVLMLLVARKKREEETR